MEQNLEKNQEASVKEKTKAATNKGAKRGVLGFFKEHLKLPFCVCAIISLAIILVSVIGTVKNMEITETSFKFSQLFTAGIKFIALDIVAGVVPFFYMSFLGFLAYLYFEIQNLAFCIIQNGWFLGILRAIIPITFAIICISYTTALGIYICKVSTAKYKLGRSTNMNWTNFRIRVYQILKNEEKYNALVAKQEKRQKKLKEKNQKYNWKMIAINIVIILVIYTLSITLNKLFIY